MRFAPLVVRDTDRHAHAQDEIHTYGGARTHRSVLRRPGSATLRARDRSTMEAASTWEMVGRFDRWRCGWMVEWRVCVCVGGGGGGVVVVVG